MHWKVVFVKNHAFYGMKMFFLLTFSSACFESCSGFDKRRVGVATGFKCCSFSSPAVLVGTF